ncbi:hypothetical protein [Vibrio harveyi]|uniref:hypothetical protein n=1 Tax=Vibrio harveyi TaxID=669 RepID=UPI003CEB964A
MNSMQLRSLANDALETLCREVEFITNVDGVEFYVVMTEDQKTFALRLENDEISKPVEMSSGDIKALKKGHLDIEKYIRDELEKLKQ